MTTATIVRPVYADELQTGDSYSLLESPSSQSRIYLVTGDPVPAFDGSEDTAIPTTLGRRVIRASRVVFVHAAVEPVPEPVDVEYVATYVTIGRNIGDVPMSEDDWHAFAYGVESALLASLTGADASTSTHYGRGVWQGIAEDSAIISAIATRGADDKLRPALADLARLYGQDAIAVVSAPSALVLPADDNAGFDHDRTDTCASYLHDASCSHLPH